MDPAASRLMKALPRPSDTLILPAVALRKVMSKSGNGVYASADDLFKSAIFGRDSLEVAEDLLTLRPKLVRAILLTMARLQGTETNDSNEEEPGKIVHEYRNVIMDGKPIDARSQAIFHMLAEKWGGSKDELAYYGSVDATPLFLKVLGDYCAVHGNAILDQRVQKRNGQTVTVGDAAYAAASWLIARLDASASGLLEFCRKNPDGILNQVWKDSDEFYVHETGERANHERPIASIEAQALAYDGLLSAAELFTDDAPLYRQIAFELREVTLSLLWQEDRQYFSLGTDYDAEGNIRPITTLTANPAALLDSKIFDDLPENERQRYITAIAKEIMSYEFLTNAGIRSRALSAAHLIHSWDYHGSFVSWPKETYDIAKGLRRQGLPALARQLENRLLNVVLKHRQYPEFVYVDGWGRILDSTPQKHSHGNVVIVNSTNNPERVQAWTVSAILAITSNRATSALRLGPRPKQAQWQMELEKNILHTIPRVSRHLNPFQLQRQYRKYPYALQ